MSAQRSPFRRPTRAGLIRAKDEAVELLIYDEIGFWGITAKQVAETLAEVDADTIHLRINSPGGDVFDGVAIHNALKQHPARVVTHIDGLAASIASVIALAGDEVRMAPNAFFMVHNPWGITIGDAEQHRKMAGTLDKIAEGAIAQTYQAKTGASLEEVETWMNEETWFNAREARDVGFADVVEEAAPAEARGALPFDLSVYHHVPAGLEYAGPSDDPLDDVSVVRELEAALRDEGLTRKEAATALSGFKKWCRRDADAPMTPPGCRDGAGAAHRRPDAADPLAAAEAIVGSMVAAALRRKG